MVGTSGLKGSHGEWDAILTDAIREAADAIAPRDGQTDVGELAHLKPRLLSTLRTRLGSRVGSERSIVELPDWNPVPSGIDIVVGLDGLSPLSSLPLVGIELKSYKLDETLWDIIKMASLRRMPKVEAAYVVVAATTKKFDGQTDCAALYHSSVGQATLWEASSWFTHWPQAWCDLLRGGSARPTQMPDTISLELVCTHETPAFPNWEIRALRVENPATLSRHLQPYGTTIASAHLVGLEVLKRR